VPAHDSGGRTWDCPAGFSQTKVLRPRAREGFFEGPRSRRAEFTLCLLRPRWPDRGPLEGRGTAKAVRASWRCRSSAIRRCTVRPARRVTAIRLPAGRAEGVIYRPPECRTCRDAGRSTEGAPVPLHEGLRGARALLCNPSFPKATTAEDCCATPGHDLSRGTPRWTYPPFHQKIAEWTPTWCSCCRRRCRQQARELPQAPANPAQAAPA
jgi:hypothetical protein